MKKIYNTNAIYTKNEIIFNAQGNVYIANGNYRKHIKIIQCKWKLIQYKWKFRKSF